MKYILLFLFTGFMMPRLEAKNQKLHGLYKGPPDATVSVTMRIYDGQDLKHFVSQRPDNVSGRTTFQISFETDEMSKNLRIEFSVDETGYSSDPPEMTQPLTGGDINLNYILVKRRNQDRADLYLQSIKTAQSLLAQNSVNSAAEHAEYAGAVAVTANQKIEAGRLLAQVELAKGQPVQAAKTFSEVAATPNFDLADARKKQGFTAEWFDTLEKAAKSMGAVPDKKTGLIFKSISKDFEVDKQLDDISATLGKIQPKHGERMARNLDSETLLFGSPVAAKESLIRKSLDRS